MVQANVQCRNRTRDALLYDALTARTNLCRDSNTYILLHTVITVYIYSSTPISRAFVNYSFSYILVVLWVEIYFRNSFSIL